MKALRSNPSRSVRRLKNSLLLLRCAREELKLRVLCFVVGHIAMGKREDFQQLLKYIWVLRGLIFFIGQGWLISPLNRDQRFVFLFFYLITGFWKSIQALENPSNRAPKQWELLQHHKGVRDRFVHCLHLSLFLFGICVWRPPIAFQRTLANVLLSWALVSVMVPHYLSQTVWLSEWDWMSVCVPLGRLITPTDKRRYDNAKDASVTGLSKWVMRAACENDDHQKCGVRSVFCTAAK